MIQGTVRWFNATKGFGFIETDSTKEDVFCHYSAIQTDGFKTLTQGDQVECEIEEGSKGLVAKHVVKVLKNEGNE